MNPRGFAGDLTLGSTASRSTLRVTGNVKIPLGGPDALSGPTVTTGPGNPGSAVGFDFKTAGPAGTALPAGLYLIHNLGAYPSVPAYATAGTAPTSVSVVVHWDGLVAYAPFPGIIGNSLNFLTIGPYTDGTINDWGLATGFDGAASATSGQIVVGQNTALGNASTSRLLVWPLFQQLV
jgi:hypothetical protein